jgi:asparagine synthase (glutamine-hydrolysing)
VNQKPLFPEDRHILLRFEYQDVYQDVLESQRRVNARTLVDQVLTAYIKILSERWLMKLNAVGQRTSLQFKTPYLDDDFITCVNRIPGRYKLKAKYILRKGMGPHLPQRIARQEKRPFFVPLALWLKDDFKELLSDILTAENIRQAGLNHKTILKMCHEHFSGKKNNAKQIWNLFILIAWHRKVKTISGR